MIKRLLPILVFCSLLIFSCKKEELAPGFDMLFEQQFSIPAGLSVFAVHHFYLKNLSSHYTNLLSDNKKTDAEIKAILPIEAELSGVFGDASFDFVEEASVRIYLETDPTDYLEFAYRLPVPLDPGNRLPLIPGLGSVKKYASQDRFSVDVSLRLRKTTPDETTTRLSFRLRANY